MRSRSPIAGIFRTPHDWALLVYYVYVVWNAPDFNGALKGFLPYVVFYALTVRSLNNWERVLGYLKSWNLALMGVAALAVASLFKVDFTGAADVTARFDGRLSLGTWLHDNPNALAHSVIVVLPLSYVLYFWKKGVFQRFLIFPACATLACYCVYETKSKGAFLVGGIILIAAGILMLISGVNPGLLQLGKKMVTGAVIGLIVMVLSWVIISTIININHRDLITFKGRVFFISAGLFCSIGPLIQTPAQFIKQSTFLYFSIICENAL